MDFARKQMEKYGWTDGKGLGKHENGISQALKPKLKRSMTGIGHDAAADFTEHWWSALYDKAASNIEVKEENGSTKKIKTKDDTIFEITNSTWKLKKKLKAANGKPQEQYKDFFVRTAVLGSGGSKTERVRESESEDEIGERDVFKMTDEELFAACEGRTAHKGARHGLKALGKLARIEKQEQLLLQQSKFNAYSHAKNKQNTDDDQEIFETTSLISDQEMATKKRKKKKRHCLKQKNSADSEELDDSGDISVSENKKKSKDSNYLKDKFRDTNIEMEMPLLERVEEKDDNIDTVRGSQEFVNRKVKKSRRKAELESQVLVTDNERPNKTTKHCFSILETKDPSNHGLHKKNKKRRLNE